MWSWGVEICFAITKFHPFKIGHPDVTFYEIIYTTSLFLDYRFAGYFSSILMKGVQKTKFCLLKKLTSMTPKGIKIQNIK